MAIENIQTSAGTVISICASLPTAQTEVAYGLLTFTAIGEITDGGEVGGTYGEATHTPLSSRLVQGLKTSFDAGTQTLQLAVDTADAGQALALTALHDDSDYAFKIVMQDGSIIYYQGKVMSFPINIGSVETIVNTSISVRINSYPIVAFV